MPEIPLVSKAHIYLTQGTSLLVFDHIDFPEEPPQIPGGSIERGESPLAGARRELLEETGISELASIEALGVYRFDMRPWRNDIEERHVWHALAAGELPETWDWSELHSGDGEPEIRFRFRWVDLSQNDPGLAVGQGQLISQLKVRLGIG